MKLLRVSVIKADTCGGLLDGFDMWMRSPRRHYDSFTPLCLLGANGAGKSQFLQVVAEIFQAVFHEVIPREERIDGNKDLQFLVEYLVRPSISEPYVHVRIQRKAEGKRKLILTIESKSDGEWKKYDLTVSEQREIVYTLLPRKIVGYTSGENETLSLPFLLSRSGYAEEVRETAVVKPKPGEPVIKRDIPDTRLMLIDYGTHLEVLVANLLLGSELERTALLKHAKLSDIHSFRCIVQLAHSAAPPAPAWIKELSDRNKNNGSHERKKIQLTNELEGYLKKLEACCTCYNYEEKTETYTFDFLVDSETKTAFQNFWADTLDLYSSFHKLAMLNDLVIPKPTRIRFTKETRDRKFASRLPEPQDEDKVFRFEQVTFHAQNQEAKVDYVALSDGEHQLAQLLGTFCMISFPNVLFLLDEAESHFNPQWRVKFISHLLDLPTVNGSRSEEGTNASQQDCLLTTHAPFVPSDMSREQVFIFERDAESRKVKPRKPEIETYGTTFDAILGECFGIRPPISEVPRQDIADLMQSQSPEEVKKGLRRLGDSVDKVFLVDHLRQLTDSSTAES